MTNDKMTNKKKYDLEERTGKFGEEIIDFVSQLPRNIVTRSLISQLVRAGTSVGANYCEADCAESRKDFEHKLGVCRKESKESKYWLRMVVKALPKFKSSARKLWIEAKELNLIFTAIINKSKANKNRKK